jgi:CubicO group peptidase (beta-lactamase class C family)
MPIRFRLAVLVLAVACSTSSRSISIGAQAGGGSVGRFHDFVDSVRVAEGWPGLAVIVVRDTGTPLVVATGVRRVGSSDPLLSTDRMHIGSNGKAITATLVGALVQRHEMRLETTVIDAFPELAATMASAYKSVTVRQLLAHAGGVAPYTTGEGFDVLRKLQGSPSEQRAAFAKLLLQAPPAFPPGTRHEYSNAGVALAGAMAERATGRSFHDLVQDLVFGPLGGRIAFGHPAADDPHQPWGHDRGLFGRIHSVSPTNKDYDIPIALEPAGDMSPTLPDYGRFIQLHLRGLRGREGVLTAATIRALHTPVAPFDSATGFGLGWGIYTRDGYETHGHSGSEGSFYSIVALQPERNLGLAILTNLGSDDVAKAMGRVRLAITARYLAE